jgi:Flp pilus assembly pilin Flp
MLCKIARRIGPRLEGELGQTIVEYAMITALVSVAVAILLMFQLDVVDLYERLLAAVSAAFG